MFRKFSALDVLQVKKRRWTAFCCFREHSSLKERSNKHGFEQGMGEP